MRITYHNKFKKKFGKLSAKSREKFWQNIEMFADDPFDPRLNNHPLKGAYAGCRSINVGGDLRAIYETNNNGIIFRLIGTHAELYDK